MTRILASLLVVVACVLYVDASQIRIRLRGQKPPESGATICDHCVLDVTFAGGTLGVGNGEGWNADVDNTHFSDADKDARVGDISMSLTGDAPFDTVELAANYPGGMGGRGHRHFRSGINTNGGGIKFSWTPALAEFWIRYYVRYATGMTWSGGAPSYTKDLYQVSGSAGFIIGFQGGGYGFHTISGSDNYPSTFTWTDWHPSGTSDGSWKCVEAYFNKSTSTLQMWIDGTQVLLNTSVVGLPTTDDVFELFTSNQSNVTSSNSYTDFDDVAVSATQRIGCFQ